MNPERPVTEPGPPRLGVCYYPEHWPETLWADDARRMRDIGLSRVRIGEFAWARIEPEPGRFDWGWLDRAINTLAAEGLGIILGTPTATPPKWLVDAMPDMVAIDAHGRPRKFGSRRHYCFSHEGYLAESARITRALAGRYGQHPAIVGWQTDNEYGCHDTTYSYSDAARRAFRAWLARRYGTITALNEAWGNVFWSMTYRHFDEIDLPNLTVTEANPAHRLAFCRFSSDQVVRFNRIQTDILRVLSPGRDICHNFMGFYTDFDHHAVGADLDVAAWDSYPLGFLEQFWFSEEQKSHYLRQGHPDIAAFHHDLYRGCSGGRWWVMEQQPGPVNWARYNPAPLPGMVRLWTLEAAAHGAELISYFRWRQFPAAQEQMHAGLLRPDSSEDTGAGEARIAASELAGLGRLGAAPKPVALVFSYEADWITRIQPHGVGYSALRAAFTVYSVLRRLGLDVDIVSPDKPLDGYRMAVIPCLPHAPDSLIQQLTTCDRPVLIGPRFASRTDEFRIPAGLAPDLPRNLLPLKVVRIESLRPGTSLRGHGLEITGWFEHLETELPAEVSLEDGRPVLVRNRKMRYLAGWPDDSFLINLLMRLANEAGLETVALPEGLRIRRAGDHIFVFNYAPIETAIPVSLHGDFLIGSTRLPPASIAVLSAPGKAQ